MSRLKETIGLSEQMRTSALDAWHQWGEVFGLTKDQSEILMDMALQNAANTSVLPPGFRFGEKGGVITRFGDVETWAVQRLYNVHLPPGIEMVGRTPGGRIGLYIEGLNFTKAMGGDVRAYEELTDPVLEWIALNLEEHQEDRDPRFVLVSEDRFFFIMPNDVPTEEIYDMWVDSEEE